MSSDRKLVFETQRLVVRIGTVEDADLFYALWTEPQVMKYVGFPFGLRVTQAEIVERLVSQGDSEFGQLLVVELKATGQSLGECFLSLPDEEGITEPDVKLLPEFWGHKYGVEVWCGLVDYQFTHTDCKYVHGTPNTENKASIKMQETAGGMRIGEGVCQFPESMQEFTIPVRYYLYRVQREEWSRNKV